MFNVLNKEELMDVNGGLIAVPYYACQEDFDAGRSRGYTWTSNTKAAYCIWLYFYDRQGNCVEWHNPGCY